MFVDKSILTNHPLNSAFNTCDLNFNYMNEHMIPNRKIITTRPVNNCSRIGSVKSFDANSCITKACGNLSLPRLPLIGQCCITKACGNLSLPRLPLLKVFVKSKPNTWPTSTNVSSNDYDSAIAKAIHNDITAPMRAYLQRNNFISE